MVSSTSTRSPGVSAIDVLEIDAFLEVLVNRLDPDAVPLREVSELWAAFDAVAGRRGEDLVGPLRRGRRFVETEGVPLRGRAARDPGRDIEQCGQAHARDVQ